jgi:hypothetical protein
MTMVVLAYSLGFGGSARQLVAEGARELRIEAMGRFSCFGREALVHHALQLNAMCVSRVSCVSCVAYCV